MEQTNIYHVIEALELSKPEYPIRPKKPVLKNNDNVHNVTEHLMAITKYQIEFEDFKILENEARTEIQEINNKIVERIKDESGLNSIVPEQYRDKVYSMAWSTGHSSGYWEVYLHLCELVNIFE